MSDPDWKKLEQLVADIQRKLDPQSRVEHNVKVPGRDSGVDRQIDVLVTGQVGTVQVRVAIDCKDYNKPADVNDVGQFNALKEDIGANAGILVCPMGFTPAALALGERHAISLYRPVDTGDHKWSVRVSAPVICDFYEAAIAIAISCSYPGPLRIPTDGMPAPQDSSGNELGNPVSSAWQQWNEGGMPLEPGKHKVVLYGGEVLIDNGYGGLAPVTLTAHVVVERTSYLGRIPIEKISGFFDEKTGGVITNAFSFRLIAPEDVVRTWIKIEPNTTEPLPNVAFRFQGLVGVEISA